MCQILRLPVQLPLLISNSASQISVTVTMAFHKTLMRCPRPIQRQLVTKSLDHFAQVLNAKLQQIVWWRPGLTNSIESRVMRMNLPRLKLIVIGAPARQSQSRQPYLILLPEDNTVGVVTVCKLQVRISQGTIRVSLVG